MLYESREMGFQQQIWEENRRLFPFLCSGQESWGHSCPLPFTLSWVKAVWHMGDLF